MKSFLSVLKTIGDDIIKGIEIAVPIIGAVEPQLAPILAEVTQIVAALEKAGATINQAQLSAIIQAAATSSAVKTATPAVSGVAN